MKKLDARVRFRNAENQNVFLRMFFREFPDTKLDIKDGEAIFTITADNAFSDHILLTIIECEILEMHYDEEAEAPAEPESFEVPAEQAEPEAPAEPEKFEVPAEQAEPEATAEPEAFEVPAEQAEPEVPAEPETFEVPAEQAEPETPAEQVEIETPAEQAEPEATAEQKDVSAKSTGFKPRNKHKSNNAKRVEIPFVEAIAAESDSFRTFLKEFNKQMIELSGYSSNIPFFWAKFTNVLSVRCDDPTAITRRFANETCESMNLNPVTYVTNMAHAVMLLGKKLKIKTSFVPFFIEVLCYRDKWDDGRESFEFESDSESVPEPDESKEKKAKTKTGYVKQKKTSSKINIGHVKKTEKIRLPKKGSEEQKRIASERAKQINVSKRCQVQLLEDFKKTSANFGEFLRRVDSRLVSYFPYVPSEEYAFARAVQIIADNCESQEDIDNISGETIAEAFNKLGINGTNFRNRISACVKKEMQFQRLDNMTLIPFVMEVVSYKDRWEEENSTTFYTNTNKTFSDEELEEMFNEAFSKGEIKFECIPSNNALKKSLLVVFKEVMRDAVFEKKKYIYYICSHIFKDCSSDVFALIKKYCVHKIYPELNSDITQDEIWDTKVNIGNFIHNYIKKCDKNWTHRNVTSTDFINDLKHIMNNLESIFNNK